MRKKEFKLIAAGLCATLALGLSACSSANEVANSENAPATESVVEATGTETSSTDASEETPDEPAVITIDNIEEVKDPAKRLEKVTELYDGLKENLADHADEAAYLLKVMTECTVGESLDVSKLEELRPTLDELLNTYQGCYCVAPFKQTNSTNMLTITVYNKDGRILAEYNVTTKGTKTYGCPTGTTMSSKEHVGAELSSTSSWGGNALGRFKFSPNEQDFTFAYDSEGRLTKVNWKEYQTKNGELKNTVKSAQLEVFYRPDGYVDYVRRTGWEWIDDELCGGWQNFNEFDESDRCYAVSANDNVLIYVAGLPDGHFNIKSVNYVKLKDYVGLPDKNLYYCWDYNRVSDIYAVNTKESGFSFLRKYAINKTLDRATFEEKLECTEGATRYLVYHSAGGSDSGWTDDKLGEILPGIYLN